MVVVVLLLLLLLLLLLWLLCRCSSPRGVAVDVVAVVVGAAVMVRGGRCVVATSTPWTRWRAAAAGWRRRM